MDILIHTDGVQLTEALREVVEDKIGHVEQYTPRALRARVRLRKSSAHASQGQFVVRVLIEQPGRDVSAEQIGPDPRVALDFVAEKIIRQLRKQKTVRLDRRVRRTDRAREKS